MDTEKEIKKIIHKAVNLLEEKAWTKNCDARDLNGYPVSANNPNAVAFCLIGSLKAVVKDNEEFDKAASLLAKKLPKGYRFLDEWNDTKRRTKEEVLKLMRSV